ncbi:MAG: transporter substrate-binding domain-containing protein, partial [Faecalispora jeddahensis]
MKTKLFSSVLAAALFAGVLSGCASNQNTGANASAAQSGAESSAAQVKTVNVALESGSKPLSFENDKGEKVGYEVDVLKAVDELITDYDFNIELVESDATQIGLETGKYALIGGGLYKTPEREQKYLIPNAINGVSLINIYVNEDDDSIKSLDDLVG